MNLQELIDELNAIRDENGDLVIEAYDDYHEDYVEGYIEVVIFEDGRMRLIEGIDTRHRDDPQSS